MTGGTDLPARGICVFKKKRCTRHYICPIGWWQFGHDPRVSCGFAQQVPKQPDAIPPPSMMKGLYLNKNRVYQWRKSHHQKCCVWLNYRHVLCQLFSYISQRVDGTKNRIVFLSLLLNNLWYYSIFFSRYVYVNGIVLYIIFTSITKCQNVKKPNEKLRIYFCSPLQK